MRLGGGGYRIQNCYNTLPKIDSFNKETESCKDQKNVIYT